MLDWFLCDLQGVPLQNGVLYNRRPGGRIEVAQHEIWKASVPLDIDDPAALLAYPLYTVLKVLMDDYPLFTGIIMKPRLDVEQGTVELNAVSSAYRLQYLFTGMRADGAALPNAVTGTNWRWTETSSAMLYYLLQHVNPTLTEQAGGMPGHGINASLQGQGPVRTRDYVPGTQAWAIFQEQTTVDDPIEWEITPDNVQTGVLATLRTFYPRQGLDKTDFVIFNAGWGLHNAVNLIYEPDGGPVINRSMQVGQTIEGEPSRFARADQPESQHGFGQYMDYQGRPDLKDQPQLAEFAQGAVSTQGWPQDFFTVVIPTEDGSAFTRDATTGSWTKKDRQFGKPFIFGPGANHDFWIGDTIAASGKSPGGFGIELSGRVHSGIITEVDSAGNTQADVQATPTVSEAGVTLATGTVPTG
jgi:hypothetical protein